MLSKADNSAAWAVVAALVLFFIGGLLTTVVPPLVDKSWPALREYDPAKGPRASSALHRPAAARPRHLRPRRLLVLPHAADPHAAGRHQALRLEGRRFAHLHARRIRLRQPAHVRHQAHRSRSLARRRQVRHAVASHAFPQSARPGARLGHAAVPLDRRQPGGIQRAGGLPPNPRPRQRLASRSTRLRDNERLHLSQRVFRLPVLRAFAGPRCFSSCAR